MCTLIRASCFVYAHIILRCVCSQYVCFILSKHKLVDFVSYGEIRRYVAIKDHVLFVYAEKSDPNYIYTVPLGSLKAVKEDPKKPHKRSVTVSPGYGGGKDRQDSRMVNVLLLDDRGKLAYQVAFNTKNDPGSDDRFILAVQYVNIAEKNEEKVLQKE